MTPPVTSLQHQLTVLSFSVEETRHTCEIEACRRGPGDGVRDGALDGGRAADGNVVYTVVLGAAASAGPVFDGLNPADVTVTNQDNEP